MLLDESRRFVKRVFQLSETRAPAHPAAFQKHDQLTYAQAKINPAPLTLRSSNVAPNNKPNSAQDSQSQKTPTLTLQRQTEKIFPDVKLGNFGNGKNVSQNVLARFFGW